ncbi:LacI family DNA-binding transcriptional regulator [Luteibacter flocculans]|uniref:LacI family DNA-binding transcriptional regulator n=1 Tax=Luteibacter flocculans TaxID=2780091 RepID=A0ABY4T1V6_9GAMM|nr:LacI family DNA-binding transcriptional regulator [Luteibacter flocculans]URL58610.1 LacI family DNA-binding transcriptional regulator [Luteibacter flocculans]
MAVTIKDVARMANVSVASVSRALNGNGGVTPETQARIREAAARLHYVPHNAARSLITRRTNTIGALLPDLHGAFFSELIRGIDLAARSRGLYLLVSSSHGDATEAAVALRAMQGRVDGLLVMSPHADEAFLDENLPTSLPTVLINSHVRSDRHASLDVDDFGGAHAMTEHLIGLGRKRIVFIAGPEVNHDVQERIRGYREALNAAGMGDRAAVLPGDFTEETGYHAGKQALAMVPRPDAIFAANDMMAIGCLSALSEAQVRTPQDIAVVGFDDIPMARYVTPPLTTVRIRIAELGEAALERLVQMIETPEDEAPRPRAVVGTELVVRASCGGSDMARRRA